MLCCRCKKNIAVVFVTKVEGQTQKNEGYCISCAKELGIAPINDILEQMGIDEEQFDEMGRELLGDNPEEMMSFMKEMMGAKQDDTEEEEPDEKAPKKKKEKKKKKKAIEQFGTNLTEKAKQGEIDRVIGRDSEIERVIQILNRRTKNNPCLIGEPGVGKTAIAEGLAVKIVNKEVPNKLLDKEVYLLDFASIVAGTQFRGQFEARVKSIIDEAKALGNVIFVIDELHNIVAAGDADGAMGAANILKPALAKGDIQVIGATTLEEYRKHIEKDSALERRFQTVMVEEPSVEETIEIIKGIRDYYEKHHSVVITDEVIRIASVLAERYINDRFMPDKVIDVIDEAGARANLKNEKLTKLQILKSELSKVTEQKDELSADGEEVDYEKVAELKIKQCQLEEEIAKLECEDLKLYITPENIAEVIEMWTKIPVKRISESESGKLINLEDRLHKRLVGQKEAVEAVARAIRINRANLSAKKRPVSFIFVGPTGVGKTELVRQIARELFDDERSLIRLDMSEYTEKHSISKIIGSPPGYVGYDDAGQLTEKVRRRPYSVILLDEIEKAHADVFNVLLQLLDEGRLTDSHGKQVSFENCIIIMTSNAGSDFKSGVAGFDAVRDAGLKSRVDSALKATFRPEFLNRIDDIIIFEELTTEELSKICDIMLSDLASGILEKGIAVEFTDSLREYIVENGYDVKFGARPMRRIISKEVEGKLAIDFISGNIKAGDKLEVTVLDGKITVVKK